ncbi:MAG TPA: GNAT family N-acetyltransferase [Planctomycetota bacterium]
MPAPAYQIRAYRPGDEHAILEAFNRIFAAVDPTFRARTLAEWRWQYERNPSGQRIFLCVTDEGRVLAQYAGIPQRVRLDGEPSFFSQSVDSMADPEFRRLAREPLFVQAGRAYDACFGGTGPEKDTLMWGLPVPAAYRIGKKQLKYELVRQQHKLVAPLAALEAPAPALEVRTLEACPPETDALFARFARERAGLAVRDRAQWRWRYEENPYHRYELGAVLREEELAGLAVFRKGSFDQREDGLLVDWMVPVGDEEARRALLEWARARAAAAGCERLTTLFPDTAPEWSLFQELGFRVHATRYFLVAWSFSARHDLAWMRRHWYYTLGDTDLC